MGEFLNHMNLALAFTSLLSAFVSYYLAFQRSPRRHVWRRYVFLTALAIWGGATGFLLSRSPPLGIGSGLVLLATIAILASRIRWLLHALADPQTVTLVGKALLYNLFCENIHRMCDVATDPLETRGDDLRVSLFLVDLEGEDALQMVGRYPLSGSLRHNVRYRIGEGTSGVCAHSGRPIAVEHLPDYFKNPSEYIASLQQYHIEEGRIEQFTKKARCYYSVPVMERSAEAGVNRVRMVVSIDYSEATISTDRISSEVMLELVRRYIENNKQLVLGEALGLP